jgi:hypothetical protein
MGVQFDPVMETVTSPSMSPIEGLAKPVAGKVTAPPAGGGYMLSPEQNSAFVVVNRALKAGAEVWRTNEPVTAGGKTYGQGSFFIPASGTTTGIVNTAASELGVDADGSARPKDVFQVHQHKIALWDSPNGSMPSGWTRYELEQFEFPFEVVCGGTLDADARSKFDVIVLPDGSGGAVPAVAGAGGGRGGRGGGGRGGAGGGAGTRPVSNDPDLAPACVPGAGGNPTAETYRKFLESGGVVIANGSSSSLGAALGLPLKDYLVSKAPGEPDKHLGGEDYYVPGSVLRAAVDTKSIAAAGMPDHIDIFYKNDPVYQLGPDAAMKGVRPVMWFDTDKPLRSGWAWGQNYLNGGTAGIEAMVGSGRLFLFSPDITFRGQPHESFKFLFNSIYSK